MDHSKFPLPPYRQYADECMPASLGTALFPFLPQAVWLIVDAAAQFKPQARGDTGYERLIDNFTRNPSPYFEAARRAVSLQRVCELDAVEKALATENATAIVALSWADGIREPHSVCVARHGDVFVLRDSSADGLGHGHTGDGVAGSLVELLHNVGSSVPTIGEAIIVRPLIDE